jgi:uracil phosphoribosyltransferase
MRGGDSMLGEVFNLIPGVSIGKVLIQRDESTKDKRPVFYYQKLPDDIAKKRRVLVLDPMCATGGTAVMCIDKLIERGVPEENITFINLVCSEEGADKVLKRFTKVKMITACVDQSMNEQRYILPGLGDFGDRYFGSRLPK